MLLQLKLISSNRFFLLLFLLIAGFIQDLSAQQKAATSKILDWKADIISKTGENESVKLLYFEGAIYDGTTNSLPYYTERIIHPFPGLEAVVTLKNAQYEPFSSTAVLDLSKIGSEPVVNARVMTEKKQPFLGISILPLRKNFLTGALERLVAFDLDIQPGAPLKFPAPSSVTATAANSVLASGNWYKLAVNTSGIHIITVAFLQQLGMNPATVNPSKIRLFGNGGGMLPFLNSEFRHDDLAENAIFVNDGGTPGVFDGNDFVLFYGETPNNWYFDSNDNRFHHTLHLYSDFTYYFITPEFSGGGSPKRIQLQSSSSAASNFTSSSFDDFKFHELEKLNFIKSGRQFYGEQFDADLTQEFGFSFPNIDLTESVYVKSSLIAHSFSPSYFRLNYGGQQLLQQNVPAVGSSYTSPYADENISATTFSAIGSDITLSLTYFPSTSTSVGYLNFLEVNARRRLQMSGSQMIFRDSKSVGPGNVTQFNLIANAGIQVWDVTDPVNAKAQQLVSGTGFKLETDELREFIAFDGSNYLTPYTIGAVANQNLHGLNQMDMVILAHPSFLSEAFRLGEFHKTQSNLDVVVITPEQIYNEFSSGARDVIGIRGFLKMFYDRATVPADLPKYLLLFGDGSYDNKGIASTNTNFLPTYQSLNSISLTGSYVSDDFYGFLDNQEGDWDDATQDLLDIGVGRFPVKTLSEATTVVNKIIDYSTPGTFVDLTLCAAGNTTSLGDWRNSICFIADDEDSGLHLDQSNNLATYVKANEPSYNIDKIYIDAYNQVSTPGGQRYPTVNEAIDRRVNKGALVVNYTGHGGETGWTGERILDNSMIQSWSNIRKLPLFITATCEFSRYDDPGRTSAGELVLINSEAGGIALMTTTRLVYASQNAVLNAAMIRSLFENVNGEKPRLGDVYVKVKNDNNVLSGGINPRNFSLLGDPALMVAYPKYDVVTTQINGAPIIALADTIGALSKVTISGEIQSNGQKLSSFNGIIYPTVFDKEEMVSTLMNDPSSPLRTFGLQKNVLYKGKASVINGEFSYTFIVPKDIAYQIGKGRLSYYAHNGNQDAAGNYDSLLIGGSSGNTVADNIGPMVKLFLNDEKFVFGGTTDENPKIYALLTDTNGINTVGNGIGHDITATIDDNTDEVYVLNDYYESDLDSYQSGRILYPLSKLSSGRHTLKFKVWDIYNNSSDAYTEFVVAESATLALNHVLNYPNPFTTKTSFFFEHNRPCNTLDVQVQVFTVSGKLIKTINRQVTCEGTVLTTWIGTVVMILETVLAVVFMFTG
ncbi:MAG: type IX secretion system sortase PorU [Bacteroidetes bacterium]|nr:type IX secretion system sortase PorU [Bacteroidota bacterium]